MVDYKTCVDVLRNFFDFQQSINEKFQQDVVALYEQHEQEKKRNKKRKRRKPAASTSHSEDLAPPPDVGKNPLPIILEEDNDNLTPASAAAPLTSKKLKRRSKKKRGKGAQNEQADSEETESNINARNTVSEDLNNPSNTVSDPSTLRSQRSAAKKASEITSMQLKLSLRDKMRNESTVSKKKNELNVSSNSTSSSSSSNGIIMEPSKKVPLLDCVVLLNRCSDYGDDLSKDNELLRKNIKAHSLISIDSQSEPYFRVPEVPLNKSKRFKSWSKVKMDTSVIVEKINLISETTIGESEVETNEIDTSKPTPEIKSVSPCASVLVLDKSSDIFNKSTNNTGTSDVCVLDNASSGEPSTSKPQFQILKDPEINEPLTSETLTTIETDKTLDSSSLKPTRIRTKNRKYNDDDFVSESTVFKKGAYSSKTCVTVEDSTAEAVKIVDTSESLRGKKRKSDSEDSSSNKNVKLTKENKKTVESNLSKTDDHVLAGPCHSPVNVDSEKSKASSSQIPCYSTAVTTKPLIHHVFVDDDSPVPEEPDTETDPKESVNVETPLPPQGRMTRTRTKEMSKKQADKKQQNSNSKLKQHCGLEFKNGGKENKNAQLFKFTSPPGKYGVKSNPLGINNNIFMLPGNPLLSSQKGSATKVPIQKVSPNTLKQKKIIQVQLDAKKKREERVQRQLAHKRELQRKEKEKLAKLQKEEKEKERQVAHVKMMKEEMLLQKKKMNENMLKEVEERRLREEEVKKARIKQQEEEKKRLAEERLRQAEEAKKLYEMRLAQEAKEKECVLKEAEKLMKFKLKQQVSADSYQLTPCKEDREPKALKNEDNYGLSECDSDESTDEEQNPKKIIPKWARKTERVSSMIVQARVHTDLLITFFPVSADMITLQAANERWRKRASSAVWESTICMENMHQ